MTDSKKTNPLPSGLDPLADALMELEGHQGTIHDLINEISESDKNQQDTPPATDAQVK